MLEGRGRVSDFDVRGHINMADSKACLKGLSLKRKLEIIQKVERHPTKQRKMIAEEFNIAPSTLAIILLTVGKFEKPQCFRGIKCLPVKYKANKRAWMDSTLFNDWLMSFDQKMAAENRKVILVIDNCPAHSKTDRHLKATELLYLPPNATCKLQPCDQGVIQNLKVHFRKLLLTKVIRHTDADADAADFQITLLNALSDLKLAWDMVTASTIKNCFCTACFAVDEESSRKTPSDQGEEQPSTGSSVPGIADYPLSGGNTEPLLPRLLKEWNISPSEYFSVDENIVTRGDCKMHRAINFSNCDQPGL